MATDVDAAKDRLDRIARVLEQLRFPSSPLDEGDAAWLAKGIRKALGEGLSLDLALGLKKPKGAPRKTKRAALVCQVWAEMKNATAEKIADEVQRRYPKTFPTAPDTKQVRRYVGSLKYDPIDFDALTQEAKDALADEVSRRLEGGPAKT